MANIGESFIPSSFRHKRNDPNYKGENINLELINGPLTRQRKCTDIICGLIFIIFLGAAGFVTFKALKSGDPRLIMLPFSSDGTFPSYSILPLNLTATN
jgi:hypothetical protein